MIQTVGILGCGSMGGAIARGIKASKALSGIFSVLVYDQSDVLRASLKDEFPVADDPVALAQQADFILLAVKPYQVAKAIETIKGALDREKTLLSIAAGVPLARLRALLSGLCPVIQIMPNTPASIGQGVFALCFDDPELAPDRKKSAYTLFAALGTVFAMPQQKMNAFSAVAGCGPAYVFHLMDAVMEGAVTLGFTRQEATEMTIALFKGSAALVEQSGAHPAALHAAVTSPSGMTIAGTNHLARTAVRGHIIDAILAADARGREMEKETEKEQSPPHKPAGK